MICVLFFTMFGLISWADILPHTPDCIICHESYAEDETDCCKLAVHECCHQLLKSHLFRCPFCGYDLNQGFILEIGLLYDYTGDWARIFKGLYNRLKNGGRGHCRSLPDSFGDAKFELIVPKTAEASYTMYKHWVEKINALLTNPEEFPPEKFEFNPLPEQEMAEENIIYIAGDWLAPPIALAERLERAGNIIVAKWWEDRVAHKANVALLMEEISCCDIFIFDMRSNRFEKHKFGGSHIGTGIALALGKTVKVILPTNATKPLTALLAPFVTKNEDDLFNAEFLEKEGELNSEADVNSTP